MARTKLLAARLRAAGDRPYLAAALYALHVVESVAVPTMGVDRFWRCYVNPAFVDATPVPELAGVWIHEVSHLLRDHHGRAGRLPATVRDDHVRVNLAQDCEINDDLVADGIALPAGHVSPRTFGLADGGLFEEYLPRVPASARPHRCGSGAYGGREPWDLPAGGVGVGATEAQTLRRQAAEAMRAHQRGRGTLPAGWQRWSSQILEPTVDWRQILAGTVRSAVAWASGAVDYTYRRPSRRSTAQRGVVLPGLRRPMPGVAVVVDTSGSMSGADLAAAMAEIAGVLRQVGIGGNRVAVLACDAAVATTQRIARVEDLTLTGGGGTDMRAGITAAAALPLAPDVIIVLTDGDTPWPAEPPPARLIAALVGHRAAPPPSWATVVQVGP
ncbi:vWA domain-containing protein [Catenuloplanes indicus]|uniref:Metal-dependent peptidase n=1 Tax=Catenuloplanes indicus TaxID=137267 RepID=A0AAE4AYR1_9ACTN|nr:VWA-like domain-containing protein [Catenuloplanes indicus]MDQ0365283.1 putative metal-dependent peptidase [Catenuloplanes indicus]